MAKKVLTVFSVCRDATTKQDPTEPKNSDSNPNLSDHGHKRETIRAMKHSDSGLDLVVPGTPLFGRRNLVELSKTGTKRLQPRGVTSFKSKPTRTCAPFTAHTLRSHTRIRPIHHPQTPVVYRREHPARLRLPGGPAPYNARTLVCA